MSTRPSKPSSGAQINHLVLSVRDLEKSHTFYTEILGFELCAIFDKARHAMDMYFYRGVDTTHHDIALLQIADPENVEAPTSIRSDGRTM